MVINTGLKGRWQKLSEHPLVICDTMHNEAAIAYLVKQLSSLKYKRLFIIWGSVEGKDLRAIFQQLPEDAFYYFCEANVPRALRAGKLREIAQEENRKGQIILDVNDAIEAARQQANPTDLIFVGGSNFIVAEIEHL